MRSIKKIVALTLVGVMCACTFTGCKKADSSKKTEKKTASVDMSGVKVLNNGVLTVGCEIGYPPFEDYANDGKTPIGFDIDLITEVADRLGLSVNIINTGFDGIFAGLDVNYDVVCAACTITPEREKELLFSTSYVTNYQTVVANTSSKLTASSFKDLNNCSVAVQKDTTSDILMSDLKATGTIEAKIVANEKLSFCFTQLTNNEVDAVVVDSLVADGYVKKNPDKYKIVYQDKSEAESFGIAMSKDNTSLQKAIDQALADMKADGTMDEIYDYWFGSKSTTED